MRDVVRLRCRTVLSGIPDRRFQAGVLLSTPGQFHHLNSPVIAPVHELRSDKPRADYSVAARAGMRDLSSVLDIERVIGHSAGGGGTVSPQR